MTRVHYYGSQFDLRNPINNEIRADILKEFGLNPTGSYEDNRELMKSIRATDLLKRWKKEQRATTAIKAFLNPLNLDHNPDKFYIRLWFEKPIDKYYKVESDATRMQHFEFFEKEKVKRQ